MIPPGSSIADRVRNAFSGDGSYATDPLFSICSYQAYSGGTATAPPSPFFEAAVAALVGEDGVPGGKDGGQGVVASGTGGSVWRGDHPVWRDASVGRESSSAWIETSSSAGGQGPASYAAAVDDGKVLSSRWAPIVGRPMLANELLRHLPGIPKRVECTGNGLLPANALLPANGLVPAWDEKIDAYVREAYYRQNKSFLAARQVRREYLADELTEDAFLREGIFDYDDDESPDEFTRRIEDVLLAGEAYSARMGARLVAVYLACFGEEMHPDDSGRCTEIARGMRATVSGDAANGISARLNEELSSIAEKASEVYRDVLGREPDRSEIRDEVPAFRSFVPPDFYATGGGPDDDEVRLGRLSTFLDAPASALRVRLHRSLEFHDVLKAIISEKMNRPRKRELFRALAALVEKCDGRPETLTESGNPSSPDAVWLVDWSALGERTNDGSRDRA